MSNHDIRWIQRFSNYQKALLQLSSAVELARSRELSDLEKQGIIQAFGFTHELAWNVIKDYFAYQGNMEIRGSRDASREAFRMDLIQEGEAWMEMIRSRNKTSHTYNEETAEEVVNSVVGIYFDLFKSMERTFERIKEEM
ncbi:MAG: nucleotidyltransferase substrate binding protein [Bacteroidia bacterium]